MKLELAALASALVLLAGCATPPATDATAPAPTQVAENKKPVDLGPPPTGSRIPNRTDRLIRVIGSQEAQEDANRVRSLSNVTGIRGN